MLKNKKSLITIFSISLSIILISLIYDVLYIVSESFQLPFATIMALKIYVLYLFPIIMIAIITYVYFDFNLKYVANTLYWISCFICICILIVPYILMIFHLVELPEIFYVIAPLKLILLTLNIILFIKVLKRINNRF